MIFHYLSLLWQTFTTHFVTNHDHAHLSGHMLNDASSYFYNTSMGLRLCLSDGHTQCTICGQEQLQETMQHL